MYNKKVIIEFFYRPENYNMIRPLFETATFTIYSPFVMTKINKSVGNIIDVT